MGVAFMSIEQKNNLSEHKNIYEFIRKKLEASW